ncbi:MAG: FAD-dependent oxidoreductase [Vicinamibacteria bacterium]
MHRRALLKTGALAALGLPFGACSSRKTPDIARRPPLRLVPADISWDRVIRTTIGLRPHRPSGFVLRAEKLDGKTLIHNYGHGGAGMSLAWGTGQMAAELALEHRSRQAAVLGCGALGLTCARQLQRRGFDVVIYAKAVPPDTTSNMSLAGFTPTSGLLEFRLRTPEWEEQFRQAVILAYRQLQLLVGPRYGVSWVHNYTPTDDERAASGSIALLPKEVETGQVLLQPGEHPFPTKYAVETSMMRIEPSIYLEALLSDFHQFGGRTVIRKFENVTDVMSLSEPLVFNCTGLGAKEIFQDQELVPLKGQLTAVIPQPEVDYGTNGGLGNPSATPGIGIHMMPRSDGLILGGTSERGVWTMDVNEEERERIVEGHIELFQAMRGIRDYSSRTLSTGSTRIARLAGT